MVYKQKVKNVKDECNLHLLLTTYLSQLERLPEKTKQKSFWHIQINLKQAFPA